MVARPRLLLVAATVAILAVTLLPTGGYTPHAHWERVQWIPFGERRIPPLGALANVALFVPFGWALARLTMPRAAAIVVVVAALLSGSVEAAQAFAHGRYPTATDVAFNVVGAAIGAWLARRS